MIDWSSLPDPTPEDRLTRAKWARGVAIVYGSALLLLVAFVTAQHIFFEPNGPTSIASAPRTPVAAHQPAPRREDNAPTGTIVPIGTHVYGTAQP
jgi:hypothetical protein